LRGEPPEIARQGRNDMHDLVRNFSLSKKIKIIVILSTSLALILASASFLWLAWYSLRDSAKMDAIGLANAIGNNCSAALLFNDSKSAREIIGALGSDHRVMEAAIYQPNGSKLATYWKEAVKTGQLPLSIQPEAFIFQSDSLIVIRDITMDKELIGSIYIQMGLDSLKSLFIKIVIIMCAIMVGVLLLTYIIASRVQRLVSKPILNLAQTVQTIARNKDYSLRANKTAQDEVGDLIDGFNDMLEQIRKRDNALRNHSAEVSQINAELNAAIIKAQEASKAKSEFLAKMSHEFRTPLNAIIGYAELLKEEMEESHETEFTADIDKIHMAARHLLALINDILDLSKIEAGKMELHLETFDVRQVIDEVLATIHDLVEKNGNQLTIEYAQDPGKAKSDSVKFRQILLNLIGNSGKFTKNGKVAVHVSRFLKEGCSWLKIRIQDTGIGISLKDQKKLFRIFVQADSSTTRKYGGTGLGLAITQRFIAMMGGHIGLESTPGHGSTFEIQLPADLQAQNGYAVPAALPSKFPETKYEINSKIPENLVEIFY
jgi:signal transduction histidine kinase